MHPIHLDTTYPERSNFTDLTGRPLAHHAFDGHMHRIGAQANQRRDRYL
jgi:hypothetical protein